jgi:AGZA family xanthine/uracil permease-like MFS transporter
MEKLFKIKELGSDLRRETIGGIVTFFAMAYIIFVNPMYLSITGMDYTAVMLATCISAAIGCLLTAFIANVPFAQAPGMGLNTFFTFSIVKGMGYTWQQGLAIVFISGIVFLILTLSPLRSKIISSIPAFLKSAISAGIGLFIALIGMFNVGLVVAFGEGTAGSYTDLGAITQGEVLLSIIGLVITILLLVWKVRGAIFIGIIATTLIGIPMGITSFSWSPVNLSAISETFLKLDFTGLTAVDGGVLAFITAVLSFFIVDCFDTAGTLVGCAANAGMLNEKGELPRGDKAMIADAIATCTGALIGTSTVTTYVESSTGIAEGARTGLAPAIVGVLFILSCFLAPVAGIIPAAATTPALIIVGVYMMAGAAKIEWSDMEQAIPGFLTIAMMPFAYSISDGIGFGFISYSIIKIFCGKAKEVNALVYVISAVFLITYFLFGL